ncbi:MAG: hypothetical protein KatS3mg103_0589 [Phycisphaerales bacterium]|nr:MAG: hypothetical protein KatS3mg103_0589 [Phycisphaerales bacterium]
MSGQRPGSSRHARSSWGLSRLRSLTRLAGRLPTEGRSAPADRAGLEPLEARILLGGDHPSFELPLTPTSGTQIVLDGMTGQGSVDGVIEGVTPDVADDLFRFVAPEDDFVTVWADTVNVMGGSDLDSRVEVYDISGMLVAQGSSQGQLTQGFFTDGWAGFVAQAGQTYFVRVLSDVDNAGQATTGGYTVRVDAITNKDLVIQTDPMAVPPPRFGTGSATGSIDLAGQDVVYRIEAGSDSAFDSLASFYAALPAMPPSELDTRVDVYDAQGQFITGDSLTGRLQTGYAVVQSQAEAVFYVRVRADRFDPTLSTATGAFELKAEMVATEIEIDPVTRRGSIFDGIDGAFDTRIYRFTTQGDGLTFAGAVGAGLVPLPQPALRLYNPDTTLRGFSDLAGLADLRIQLPGNSEFFIIIETFDNPAGGTYNVFIESNHTFIPSQGVDDHATTPTGQDPTGADLEFEPDEGFTNPEQYDFIRQTFEQATPLRWSDPLLYTRTFVDPTGMFDDVVNPVADRSYVQVAQGTGRIHAAGDTDLFQFTIPLDMLGEYAGDNDDAGDALFAGGQGKFIIKGTDNDTRGPILRDFLGIWDAQDWWPVRAGVDMTVNAMMAWEYDPDADIGGTALIIGGEFQFADFQPAPFIAAYAYDPTPGVEEYVLVPLAGGLDGSVHDFAVFDFDPDDDIESQLIVAGEFSGGIVQYVVEPGDFIANGSFQPVPAVVAAGNVYAVEAWDPADPEMGDENPLGLYFGGDGGVIQSIVLDDDMGAIAGPTFSVAQGVGNGLVLDMKAVNVPQDEGEDIQILAVGGQFDDLDGTAVSNVALIGGDTAAMGPGVFTFDPMAGGTDDVVRALETWDRDGEGELFAEEVIVGGDFQNAGGGPMNFIGSYNGGWAALSIPAVPGAQPGFNAPVHSLNVFVDSEFGVGQLPFDENPVLYAGGEFTLADGQTVSRIAQLVFDPFLLGWTWTGLGLGSTDTVFALENFNDELPNFWDRDDRPAARLRLDGQPRLPARGADVRADLRLQLPGPVHQRHDRAAVPRSFGARSIRPSSRRTSTPTSWSSRSAATRTADSGPARRTTWRSAPWAARGGTASR